MKKTLLQQVKELREENKDVKLYFTLFIAELKLLRIAYLKN